MHKTRGCMHVVMHMLEACCNSLTHACGMHVSCNMQVFGTFCMHVACLQHACYMHVTSMQVTCGLHAFCMHTVCKQHADYMHVTCVQYASYMWATCMLHVYYMHATYTLHAGYMSPMYQFMNHTITRNIILMCLE